MIIRIQIYKRGVVRVQCSVKCEQHCLFCIPSRRFGCSWPTCVVDPGVADPQSQTKEHLQIFFTFAIYGFVLFCLPTWCKTNDLVGFFLQAAFEGGCYQLLDFPFCSYVHFVTSNCCWYLAYIFQQTIMASWSKQLILS